MNSKSIMAVASATPLHNKWNTYLSLLCSWSGITVECKFTHDEVETGHWSGDIMRTIKCERPIILLCPFSILADKKAQEMHRSRGVQTMFLWVFHKQKLCRSDKYNLSFKTSNFSQFYTNIFSELWWDASITSKFDFGLQTMT